MFLAFVSLVRKSIMHCGMSLSDVCLVLFTMRPKRDEEVTEKEMK